MKLDTLRDLYIDQLQDLYSAEEQLTKALPKMVEAAAHPELKSALRHHLEQTQRHVQRLEETLGELAGHQGGASGMMETVYKALGRSPAGKKCAAMAGLISEGEEVIKASGDRDVRDAGMIAAAQRVEHYEIASYGTVCTYAEMLGRSGDKRRLGETLAEEKAADEKLNILAKQVVNVDAAAAARH